MFGRSHLGKSTVIISLFRKTGKKSAGTTVKDVRTFFQNLLESEIPLSF